MTAATVDQADQVREALESGTAEFGQGFELTASDYMTITCEALSALAGHVTREYGEYGYVFERIRSITHAVALGQVRHFDGSRFILAADKWGNVRRLDNSGLDAMAGEIAEMHANAVAV